MKKLRNLFNRIFRKNKLYEEDVKWIVNDIAELGVEINGQMFFLYKGRSFSYGIKPDIKYRPVFKREFGECCHPRCVDNKRLPQGYVGFNGESHTEWRNL